MSPSFFSSTGGHDGPDELLWEDGERIFRKRWRRTADGTSQPVLAVLPAASHPTPGAIGRLAHEYGLKDELYGGWAIRPIALESDHGATLVLEFPGGRPLHSLLGSPMELGLFLRLAISLSQTISQMHRRGIVHKDIKPSNVLLDTETGRVWLMGFGIASRFPRERLPPNPPELIAGTLPYMAPEQTGRMNRSVDSRSDLYALGVTLYEMLTGSLPFSASDPMEWVHCHVARRPMPPEQRAGNIPAAISAIVMKLLAKTAENRYQTAAGAEHDLRHCLDSWNAHSCIDVFPIGQNDTPDRLIIPEKLYGRAREVETLTAAFDQMVASGRPSFMLISGYSGIGKSSVVNELHKVLVPPRGLFASGKFDQYKRDVPYATLVQAFQGLVRSLLGKGDAELAAWRDLILQGLEPNASLMTDLIPELSLIVGDQPPVPELDPHQAKIRFQLVLRQFIVVFARSEHPLALFLDDLQWLDTATLEWLEDLSTRTEPQHLMLIGAYRDNEVGTGHPLTQSLDTIRKGGANVQEIRLAPLTQDDLTHLIVDVLRCDTPDAAPLARLVREKTAGNPYFLIQFLYALADEGLLLFDHELRRWSCDLGQVHAKGYTDNVADFMANRLTRLPVRTQYALQQLALLGNTAEIATLSTVLAMPEDQVHSMLWPAVRQELAERLENSYKFSHDRVHEAAYSLVPVAQLAAAHLRIGRLLAAQATPEERDEAIFDIVNQLNRGTSLVTQQAEREQLAEFNLLAAKRAMETTAYNSALTYLSAGMAGLAPDSWVRRPDLCFALELNRAECEFLIGAMEAADERLAALSSHASTTVERADVTRLHMDVCTTLDQTARAVDIGLLFLRHVGIEWSPHPSDGEVREEYERIWSLLGNRAIEALIDLPHMEDPDTLATIEILDRLLAPASFTDANLDSLTNFKAISLSLERGNCDASCSAYIAFAKNAGPRFGDYKLGFRFGELGFALVQRRGLKRFEGRTYLAFSIFVARWMEHVRHCRSLLLHAFESANRIGELTIAAYACTQMNSNLLFAGEPLSALQVQVERGLAYARSARFGLITDFITAQLALIQMLRGMTPQLGRLDSEQFNELRAENHLASQQFLALAACMYWIRKLQARYIAGDYTGAMSAISAVQPLLWHSYSYLEEAEYHFYGALARAAYYDTAPVGDLPQHLTALAAHKSRLQAWADSCPENFEGRAALVGAEIARIEGRELDAEQLYESAIRSARDNGFMHNEALANELASRFYAARGFKKIARVYLKDARHCYLRWGADGKVRQLDGMHPYLVTEEVSPGPTNTIAAPVDRLDLSTVIKVSQAVSGEIETEKMIDTLMRTAISHAGAERGLLILAGAAEPQIAAEAATSGEAILVRLCSVPVSASALPETILNRVLHGRDNVILHDAIAEPTAATDPYILKRQVRSVLCLPLINQSKLIGVLYLENGLVPHVFVPSRIAVLKVVASQAATSLENTRLYGDLREREAKIRQLVDSNIIGIFIWEIDGALVDANDAFRQIVGYDRAELVSHLPTLRELTPVEWREVDNRGLTELRSTGASQPYEKEYFRKDGSRVPVLVGATLFEGGDEAVGFVVDLTDQRRAEAAVREREVKAQWLIDTSLDAVMTIDEGGRITEWNTRAETMFGWLREETIGQRYLEMLIPRRFQSTHEERLQRFLTSGKGSLFNRPIEIVALRRDGREFPVEVSIASYHINGSWAFSGFVRDATERKRAEASLRRHREIEMELAHANRIAAMGQLSASIAHEVKQPISAAITNANIALRWLDADPSSLKGARDAIERIVRSSSRANEVVDRVREFVRKTPPQKDLLNINEAILEVIALSGNEAAKNGISVRTRLAASPGQVQGDRVQLQQVILNLMMNAIEAMCSLGDHSRELLISTECGELNSVRVMVQDSGPGLSSSDLEHVFDAFYTTKSSGMGMGLSICRSIIEAHGGRLWAGAVEPRGAAFTFMLPASSDRRHDLR